MKLRRPFNGNFPLTQGFGERPEAYAQFGLKGHNGLDYGLPHGTPVVAALEGKVTEVGNDTTGYGGYVKVENSAQGQLYGHLSRIDVKVGDTIYEGQQLGLSGGTKGTWGAGNTTGAHLHWGFFATPRNRSNGYAGYVDQAPLLISRDEQAALPTGRTYVSVGGAPVQGDNGLMVPVPSADFERMVNKSGKWDYTVKDVMGINEASETVGKDRIKTFVDDLKNKLNDALRRLTNIKDETVDGNKVGWYITELANRSAQVDRLKDELKLYQTNTDLVTEYKKQLDAKGKEIGELNHKVETLESDKRTLQTNLDTANTRITQLETELQAEKDKDRPIGGTIENMSIYDAFMLLVSRVLETLKGTQVKQS